MDEKLSQILGQMRIVRRRINTLAWQQIAFRTLATLIACGALVIASAYLLRPLGFLICATIAVVLAASGVIRSARLGWSLRASALQAAEIADERAELRGRLTTVVAMARNPRPGSLWPYLIEDTLARSDEFVPSRIESRRLSRSIYGLAGSLLIAALVFPLSRLKPQTPAASKDLPPDITLDLNDLHLRPADSDDPGGVEVSADPQTMRAIQNKFAREGGGGSEANASPFSNLMNRAQSMAGNMQNRLTGRDTAKPRLTLHLADAGDSAEQNQQRGPNGAGRNANRERDAAGQFKHEHVAGEDQPLPPPDESAGEAGSQPTPTANPDAANDLASSKNGRGDDAENPGDAAQQSSGDRASNGGATHGVGADPDTLFGSPANAKLGSEGFEISIEARPMEKGSNGAGHAYVPPKVKTPLNTEQEPDEPVARASVPSDDRATIKRVFDR